MLKRFVVLAIVACMVLVVTPSTAFAARPSKPGGEKSQPTYGIDISYPQCGRRVPTDQAFGIVGVNGGKASTYNSCLTDQLRWAAASSGATSQPKLQLYLNTANPGEVQHLMDPTSPWPTTNNQYNPYAPCNGGNDQACSWQYGWDKAQASVAYFVSRVPSGVSANPSEYYWWLDIETTNSWQGEELASPSQSQFANNIAAIEGWVAYLRHVNAKQIGVYSTTYQWSRITGSEMLNNTNLNGLPNWYALGNTNANTAKAACADKKAFIANSSIALTQYISKNLDYNYACA